MSDNDELMNALGDEDPLNDSVENEDLEDEIETEISPAEPVSKFKPQLEDNTDKRPQSDLAHINADELQQVFGEEIIKRFRSVTNTILDNFEDDRGQIQKSIDILYDNLENDITDRARIEALANLLKTKADTNANAVRVLDAIARFMNATKNNNLLQINNNLANIDYNDLEQILNQPDYSDE